MMGRETETLLAARFNFRVRLYLLVFVASGLALVWTLVL
jgi:hypothetical protein